MRPRVFVAILPSALAALTLVLSGCGGGATTTGSGKAIEVDGSSTVFRISKAARDSFKKVDPSARIVVDNHGTGGGFARYLDGEVDIVDASRDAKPDEQEKAKAKKLDWTRFLVGHDGITLVVNAKNTSITELSVPQLKDLFAVGSKIKTWKDLDPSWPAEKISLNTPDDASGTYEFFVEAVLGKGKKTRTDVQASPDDNTLVRSVASDPYGLGYFGYAYFAANQEKLRAVPIREKADGAAVLPDPKSILDGSYKPLSRPLYIFAKTDSLKRPEVLAFVTHYLENVSTLAESGGYVSPTAEERAQNQKTLATAAKGAGAQP
ncbi:MAG: pstS [Planctomycetota bacterium]|nr:pstS [Planctomycetota bacterium]